MLDGTSNVNAEVDRTHNTRKLGCLELYPAIVHTMTRDVLTASRCLQRFFLLFKAISCYVEE